jgi:uncharacterized membrane protein YjgN (DUF898 family)
MQYNSKRFTFDGGAATYWGTALLAYLITICTFGICYPFAVVLKQRWRAKHSYIDGQQLIFTGSAWGLFGNWIKWLLLSLVTCGIHLLWVGPKVQKWVWENTDFAAVSHYQINTPNHTSLSTGDVEPRELPSRPIPPSRRDKSK